MPLDLAGQAQTTTAPTPTGVNTMPLDTTQPKPTLGLLVPEISTQPAGDIVRATPMPEPILHDVVVARPMPDPTLGLVIAPPTAPPTAPTITPTLAPVHKWEIVKDGSQYTIYKDGKLYDDNVKAPYVMMAVERATPNDIIIREGVTIQEGAGAEAARLAVLAQQQKEAADAARYAAQREEQAKLLSGFKGAVAIGEIRSATTPGLPIGIEAMKVAEKQSALERSLTQPIPIPTSVITTPVIGIEAAKASELKAAEAKTAYAQSLAGTTPQEAAAISKMLQSPTAIFGSQEAMQKGFDIVQGKGLSITPEQVQASVYVAPPPPKVELPLTPTLPSISEQFGVPTLPKTQPTPVPIEFEFHPPQKGSIAELTAPSRTFEAREKESFTTPILKPTRDVSKYLREEADKLIGVSEKTPSGIKTAISGATSVFTGLPEFVGQTIFAGEQIVRHPKELAKVATIGVPLFVKQTKEAAIQDPYRFSGSLVGMAALGKVGKVGETVKSIKIEKSGMPTFHPEAPGAKYLFGGKEYIAPETIFEPKVATGELRYELPKSVKEAPIGIERTKALTEYAKEHQIKLPGEEIKAEDLTLTHKSERALPETLKVGRGHEVYKRDQPGLYAAPRGTTIKESFGIGEEQVTYNPLKWFGKKSEPTVTILEGGKIKEIPEAILKDLEATKTFIEGSKRVGRTIETEAGQKIKIPEEQFVEKVNSKWIVKEDQTSGEFIKKIDQRTGKPTGEVERYIPRQTVPGEVIPTHKFYESGAEPEFTYAPGTVFESVGSKFATEIQGKKFIVAQKRVIPTERIVTDPLTGEKGIRLSSGEIRPIKETQYKTTEQIFKESEYTPREVAPKFLFGTAVGYKGISTPRIQPEATYKPKEEYKPIEYKPIIEGYKPREYKPTKEYKYVPQKETYTPLGKISEYTQPIKEEIYYPIPKSPEYPYPSKVETYPIPKTPEYPYPSEAKPIDYLRPPSIYGGKYNPLQPLRPYKDIAWNEALGTEIPVDFPAFGKDGEKIIKEKKKKIKYERKERLSPIFGGAEKLFEGIQSPIRTSTKALIKRTIPKGNKLKEERFDLGFKIEGVSNNKKQNKNKKQKEFWSV